jgi:hypothetical protein
MYASKITFSPQRPASTLRLCTECKFYRPILFKQTGLCTICGDINLVNGKRELMLAEDARFSLCGEEGDFYIPSSSKQFPIILYEKDFQNMLDTLSPFGYAFVIFLVIVLCAKNLD